MRRTLLTVSLLAATATAQVPVSLQALGFGSCRLHCDPLFQLGMTLGGAGATFGMHWFDAQGGASPVGYADGHGVAAQLL